MENLIFCAVIDVVHETGPWWLGLMIYMMSVFQLSRHN